MTRKREVHAVGGVTRKDIIRNENIRGNLRQAAIEKKNKEYYCDGLSMSMQG